MDELSLCRRFPRRTVSAGGKSHPERIRRATLAAANTPALAGAADPVGAAEGSDRIELSLDTTFLCSHDRSLGRQHEVLIGHGQSAAGKRQVIGTLLKHDLSSERVSACLASLGRTPTTEVTAFTDGDKVLRMLLRHCGIRQRPILDWEHVARKLERLKIIARGFRPRFRRERGIKARILATLDRINWRLWHGQLEAALRMIKTGETLITRLAPRSSKARPPPKALSLRTGINLLRDYITGQAAHLANYAARHRAGLPIGTAPTESLANSLVNKRMNKSQQMRSSPQGAQAVIILRTAHINRLLLAKHVKPHSSCLPPHL